jgi:2-amino-4-hydroxy-6-hydroxymethyldihydropteridine diphosphokinase
MAEVADRTPRAHARDGADAAPHRAFVGLGANLGPVRSALESALRELDRCPRTRVVAVSSLYRSAPVDATGPDFVNAVAEVATALEPAELLAELHRIEASHGRERTFRNAPRTLDLDLLLYDDAVVDTPTLRLPHPRMHERAFVLRPLAEIAPLARIPGQQPLERLLDGCAGQAIERLEAHVRETA